MLYSLILLGATLLVGLYLANDPVLEPFLSESSQAAAKKETLLQRLEKCCDVDHFRAKHLRPEDLTRTERAKLFIKRAIRRYHAATGGQLLNLKRLSGVLKILLTQYQCLSVFSRFHQVQWPTIVQQFYEWIESIALFEIDLFDLFPIECLLPHHYGGFLYKLIAMLITPLLVVVFFLIVGACVALQICLRRLASRQLASPGKRAQAVRTHSGEMREVTFCRVWFEVLGSPHCWTSAITLLLIFYPTLSRMILAAYDAAPVCTNLARTTCLYYLRYDTRVVYGSEDHIAATIVSTIGAAVYCAGVPLFFVWAVRRYSSDRLPRSVQSRITLLTGGYRHDASGSRYFEAVEMTRRLLLTAVVTMFLPGSMEQLWIGTMLSVSFTFLYVRIQPFDDILLMYLQTTNLVMLMFIYLTASLFVPQSQYTGPTNPETFGIGVLSINLIVAVLAFLVMLYTLFVTQRTVNSMRVYYAADRTPVRLSPPHGGHDGFHLFLSHVWRWAQDQAATIKGMLVMTLPETKVCQAQRSTARQHALNPSTPPPLTHSQTSHATRSSLMWTTSTTSQSSSSISR